MKRRIRIRCSCVNLDGTQCGRTTKDGSQPPVCHIHRHVANGHTTQFRGLNPPKPVSLDDALQKLLRSKDERVRIAAIQEWQRYEERQAAKGRDQNPGDYDPNFFAVLTDDERRALADWCDRYVDLKAAIYAAHPDLMPDTMTRESLEQRERDRLSAERAALPVTPVHVEPPDADAAPDADDPDDPGVEIVTEDELDERA